MKRITQTIFVLLLILTAGCADSNHQVSIALSLPAPQNIDYGQSFNLSATLTNDSQAKGVTWNLNGAGTLSGQTSTSVAYSAPSSAAARANRPHPDLTASSTMATITATSVSETQITSTLNVTINPPPSVNAPTLPDAVVGTAYSQTVTGSGGSGALTYSLNSGALPAGISLNTSTGAISGTPTGSAGTSTFTIKVTDASTAGAQSAVSGNISIKVDLPAGPSINTNSLPAGTVGVAYNNPISATGGIAPLAYSVSAGTLPAGLSLGASGGAITGTPTTQGSATFTVKVTDSSSPTAQTATKQFTIVINASLTIISSSLPSGTVGTAYSAPLTEASGVSPFNWSITNGALPVGLNLNASTGAIFGTPTASGIANFTVQVVDSGSPHQTATKALSITINAVAANICNPANTGSESLLNGQYAMVLQGFNNQGPVVYGATFNADGAGHIGTQVGTLDTNANTGSNPAIDVSIDSLSSSYTLGPDHRGCLTIKTSGGTLPFSFTVSSIVSGVATKGHIIETNIAKPESASGTLYKQDPTAFSDAKLNGTYAFGISGPSANQNKFSAVGLFHLDGVQNITGQWDTNFAGNLNSSGSTFPSSAISFTFGVYGVPSDGRGTLAFTPAGDSTHGAIIYVVDATSFLMMSGDKQSTTTPLFAGSATLQTGGPYSNSSMNAVSVFGTSGISSTSGSDTIVRVGRIVSSNTNFSYFYNDAGGSSSSVPSTSLPVTISVDTAGRGILSNAGGLVVLALTASNQGYMLFMRIPLVSSSDSSASIGQFWPQTGGPYNDLTFGGGDWSFGSSGADSVNSVHTDGWANFVASSSSEVSMTTGNTDMIGATVSFNTPFSELVPLNPVTGALQWFDSTFTNQLRFGFMINQNTAIAVDSVSSTTPTLLFYEAQQ